MLVSRDFVAWEAVVGLALGHQQSRLLPASVAFEERMRIGELEEFSVLQLQGCGQVELLREQCGHGVLWLPLRGAEP